jgi:hydroxyethylthiazole kinase-like uncharacterized protein yjeF
MVALLLHPSFALPALPAWDRHAHKGTRGTVVVIGGSATMIGAPCFAAHAALRSGAGVVYLVVPTAIRLACLGLVPSAMALLPDARGRFLEQLDEQAVVVMGMGMRPSAAAARLLARVLASGRRMVIDGGAFRCLRGPGRPRMRAGQVILTPHPGEWRTLAGIFGVRGDPVAQDTRPAAARALAQAAGCCVVLKGPATVISDPRHSWVNATGDVSLSIPGSGDSLGGIIAALLARGLSVTDAARLGAHVHGRCGERWSAAHGYDGLSAKDLADQVPMVLRALTRRSRRSARA